MVRWVKRDVAYHRMYPARVETFNVSDGTVDVTVSDESFAGLGLQRVPIRPGLPNTRIEPDQGATCLLGFEGGDPRRPYVAAWSELTPGKSLLDGGSRKVARMGDPIQVEFPPVVTVTGVAGGSVVNPNPPPLTLPVPNGPLLQGVATIPPGLTTGNVATGNPKIKA